MSADNNVIISVKDLKKYYNDGEVKALDGVTTDIKKGEVVVVIGPSGSGKSTFLRCLNLLETPDEGEVYIDGEQINAQGVDVNVVRQKMGMVFQHFNLFPHLTVLQNITLAPIKLKKMTPEQAHEKALELQQFFEDEDWNNYGIKVHALKSTSRLIGAMELSKLAEHLEECVNNNTIADIQNEHKPLIDKYLAFKHKLEPLLTDKEKEADKKELSEIPFDFEN